MINELAAQFVTCGSLYLSNLARNKFMANCFEFIASRIEYQFADADAFFKLSVTRTDNHIRIKRGDVVSG